MYSMFHIAYCIVYTRVYHPLPFTLLIFGFHSDWLAESKTKRTRLSLKMHFVYTTVSSSHLNDKLNEMFYKKEIIIGVWWVHSTFYEIIINVLSRWNWTKISLNQNEPYKFRFCFLLKLNIMFRSARIPKFV